MLVPISLVFPMIVRRPLCLKAFQLFKASTQRCIDVWGGLLTLTDRNAWTLLLQLHRVAARKHSLRGVEDDTSITEARPS